VGDTGLEPMTSTV